MSDVNRQEEYEEQQYNEQLLAGVVEGDEEEEENDEYDEYDENDEHGEYDDNDERNEYDEQTAQATMEGEDMMEEGEGGFEEEEGEFDEYGEPLSAPAMNQPAVAPEAPPKRSLFGKRELTEEEKQRQTQVQGEREQKRQGRRQSAATILSDVNRQANVQAEREQKRQGRRQSAATIMSKASAMHQPPPPRKGMTEEERERQTQVHEEREQKRQGRRQSNATILSEQHHHHQQQQQYNEQYLHGDDDIEDDDVELHYGAVYEEKGLDFGVTEYDDDGSGVDVEHGETYEERQGLEYEESAAAMYAAFTGKQLDLGNFNFTDSDNSGNSEEGDKEIEIQGNQGNFGPASGPSGHKIRGLDKNIAKNRKSFHAAWEKDRFAFKKAVVRGSITNSHQDWMHVDTNVIKAAHHTKEEFDEEHVHTWKNDFKGFKKKVVRASIGGAGERAGSDILTTQREAAEVRTRVRTGPVSDHPKVNGNGNPNGGISEFKGFKKKIIRQSITGERMAGGYIAPTADSSTTTNSNSNNSNSNAGEFTTNAGNLLTNRRKASIKQQSVGFTGFKKKIVRQSITGERMAGGYIAHTANSTTTNNSRNSNNHVQRKSLSIPAGAAGATASMNNNNMSNNMRSAVTLAPSVHPSLAPTIEEGDEEEDYDN